jgi:hypothetical protein
LLKWVHRLSKSQSLHRSTYEYGCVDMLELSTGFDQACLQIIGIRIRLALKSKLQWVLATFHNSWWIDHSRVCNGSIEAFSILDHVGVEEIYSHIASRYHSV